MSAGKLKGIRFPGQYIQGPNAFNTLARETLKFADYCVALVDPGVFDILAPRTEAQFDGSAHIIRFSGECSLAELARIKTELNSANAGVIVGIGGGKALDTAKAAAEDAEVPVIVVPTAAASDAPCSALAVIYNSDGSVSHDRFLKHNPSLVLVDSAIIAQAPERLLAAGIGDGLATWYEAESCRLSGATNCMDLPGMPLAYQIASTCRDILFQHATQAMRECAQNTPGPALEAVIEANILLSGIGFESGGVASAHAIHHGLAELPAVHHALHGEKVAIGILAGLLIQKRAEEYQRVREFLALVGLPTRLSDIGLSAPSNNDLQQVAARACRPGEIIHNEPEQVTEAMVVAALSKLAAETA